MIYDIMCDIFCTECGVIMQFLNFERLTVRFKSLHRGRLNPSGMEKENIAPPHVNANISKSWSTHPFDATKTVRLLKSRTSLKASFDGLRTEAVNAEVNSQSQLQSLHSELNVRQ